MSVRNLLATATLGGIMMGSAAMASAGPSLTIYNGDFAVVRDQFDLTLDKGSNQVKYQNITQRLEPDSVLLRSRDGKRQIQVLEQNYLANTVSESLLLHHFEGQTIDFEIIRDQKPVIVPGKIVRSGYNAGNGASPIIELEGKTRFGLPGKPLFPALKDDTLLKPTLQWHLNASHAGNTALELAYITGGLNWKADYNIVANEKNDKVRLNGWVTFSNNAGKDFSDATIKLMAGDVNKITPSAPMMKTRSLEFMAAAAPAVSEKAFDEFHLYTLQNRLNLQHGETKQVEFVSASDVTATKLYVYDGAASDPFQTFYGNDFRNDPNYGTQSNSKVWIMREFANSKANQLGIPLPKGRVRFYQQDDDQQLEFIGENNIDHTPKDETVRLYTGNAFDVTGKRERTDYQVNSKNNWIKESFRITVKNRKEEAVNVRVVEHLLRWSQWNLEQASLKADKRDASTIEFTVPLKANEEKVVTYTVHYSW